MHEKLNHSIQTDTALQFADMSLPAVTGAALEVAADAQTPQHGHGSAAASPDVSPDKPLPALTAEQRKAVMAAIRADQAVFLGQGDWEKDCAFQAYEYQGRCYVLLVVDSMSCWLEDSTLQEVRRGEVGQYI